jgi:hypothetical protein
VTSRRLIRSSDIYMYLGWGKQWLQNFNKETMWEAVSSFTFTDGFLVCSVSGLPLRYWGCPPPWWLKPSQGHCERYSNPWSEYQGVSKSFRTGRLERELQMVQLSATRCSWIAVFWVSLVSFDASQRVFLVVVYFVTTQSGNFWIYSRVLSV